jgi:hypothetical protein
VHAWAGPPHAEHAAQAARHAAGDVRDFGIRHEGTQAFRLRAATECIDTLGMLRSYREPLAGEAWRIPAASEHRLLAQARAVLVLGAPAVEHAQRLAIDPDVPDADRVFAALFVSGCTAGTTLLAPCIPLLRTALQRDRAEAAAAVEALCLCPSVELPNLLLPLARDPLPSVRAAAVRVLSYRGELPTADWCEALRDPDPRVGLAALGGALHGLERGQAEHALKPLYETSNEMMLRAALRAGMALGLGSAQQAARAVAASTPSRADALYLVALHGDPADRALIDRAITADLPAAARAAARAGWLDLGTRLLATYGAAPDVVHAVSSIAALPADLPPDAQALARAWVDATRELDPSRRHRQGRALGMTELARQLRLGNEQRPQRQELYFELQVLARGQLPRFNAFDFVGNQLDALDRLDAALDRARAPASGLR